MSVFQLIILVFAGMSISLIAIHLWVGIIDGIIVVLKKLFHIKRKEKITWHTLDGKKQKISQDGAKTIDIQDRKE